MAVRFTKSKLCAMFLASTISVGFTGCGEVTDYESILNKNQFVYEQDENNIVDLADSNICDEDIIGLSDEIIALRLYRCNYLTSLNDLSIACPNIRYICIDRCASLDDFSFIYELPNLEYLEVRESAFVTQEIVDYLDGANIQHTIKDEDILVAEQVDKILDSIITEDMDDEGKVRAISGYLMEEFSYDVETADESNLHPLSSFLKTNKGVCASYAYLANALIRKADINSYEITSSNHGWNVLELDGKYYYLDSTSLKMIPFFSEVILKKFGIGCYYLSNPGCSFLTAMEKYDDVENAVIPNSLILDIMSSEDEKNIIEKYKNTVPVVIIQAIISIAISSSLIDITINKTTNLVKKVKDKKSL